MSSGGNGVVDMVGDGDEDDFDCGCGSDIFD